MVMDRIRGAFRELFAPRASTTSNPEEWFIKWIGGGEKTKSGIKVTGRTALTYSFVWQAVNVIAGDMSQLPIKLYRRVDDLNREVDREHPAFRLLRRPHRHLAWSTFCETLESHALLWGNGYAEIIRDGARRPKFLVPLLPDRTEPVLKNGRLYYETRIGSERDTERPAENKMRRINPENVLHVPGLGFDGLSGYSVITLARESWGLGLSAEQHGARFFGTFAQPQMLLSYPHKVDPEQAERDRRNWEKLHGEDARSVAVLSGGVTATPLTMSNTDSQFLESRKFSRSEVASWFNLPPHKVGDLERATFSNITDQNRDYLQRSLMRWLVKWQEELNEKLLTEEEKDKGTHYFEFNTDAFLRGDKVDRTTAQVNQVLNGGLTINEWRAQENLNGIGPAGDVHWMPLNITTVDLAMAGPPEPEANPAGDQAPQEDDEMESDVDPVDEENGGNDRARAIAVAVLTQMLRAEAKSITGMAKTSKNFLDAVDTFYKKWEANLAENIMAMGGTRYQASSYVVGMRQLCLDVAGQSLLSNLAENAEMAYSNYAAKAEAIVDGIFEENGNEG